MNFLAHLYLSGNDPAIIAGNFMGDFVKGRLTDSQPQELRNGIMLHRRIDSFVQQHDLVRRSRQRFSPYYGHYRGVILDLFYDHFLVMDWKLFSDEELEVFLFRTRQTVERYRPWMPERLVDSIPVIFEQMLPSYATVEGVADALLRMSRRIPRSNPLGGAEAELIRHYHDLRDDFRQILPSLTNFADDERRALLNGDTSMRMTNRRGC